MAQGASVTDLETADTAWMGRAIELAAATIGLASPNPHVGCVLVRKGRAVGSGAHIYENRDHAEVVALREAGAAARGATAYVTLEPCSHTGRTPPCADALIRAGVSRVVIATGDPNPLVNGQGAARLREHGIDVSFGVMAEQARALNNGFARCIRSRLPFVLLKAALSLDGRIAPAQRPPGSVAYLTGQHALDAVQQLRHQADALLTGIGTVLEDNPLLSDRSGLRRRRRLLRVVLDSALRLPLAGRLARSVQQDVLVIAAEQQEGGWQQRRAALENAGIAVRTVPAEADSRLDVRAVLRMLAAEHAVLSVLAEGGSRLNRTLLQSTEETGPVADRLCLFYAPVLLGEQGVPMLAGQQLQRLQLRNVACGVTGRDIRIDAYLRDPWRDEEGAPDASIA